MIISKNSIIYDEQKNEYVVGERVGGGGCSAVFKIKSKKDGQYYALKTFSSDFEDETELKTFRNEIAKAMGVKSNYVVEYKFFNDGEIFPELPPYIIMEYCPNGTLRDYLTGILKSEKHITNEEIKNIFSQLIKGMSDINKKVIHRDIKLENILIKDNTLKISDFGISKSVVDTTRTITFKGWGTPEYIAPEGWKLESNTIKMDIYSMGIVFYQVATLLQYPYNVKDKDYREAHLYETPISPRRYNTGLELNLESIICKMLEKEPSKRFNNWEEIKNLIEVEKTNNNAELLNRIIRKRMDIDERNRKMEIEEIKKQEAIDEKKKMISYSIYENIYIPIKELIDDFNKTYASGKIALSTYKVGINRINQIQANTVSGKRLNIIINIVIEDKFEQEYQDPFFGQWYKKEYRPKLNNKEILAWGSVYFEDLLSYNLILLDDEKNMYGKWYQLKNKNAVFNPEPRYPEPFAFDFNELEEEIQQINSTHIYTSCLEEFNKEELLNNIEGII